MGKRKVEEDDDEDVDWRALPRNAYQAKRPSASRAVATRRVKDEHLEGEEHHDPFGTVRIAGTSTSTALLCADQSIPHEGSPAILSTKKRSKRVKKDVDEGPPPEKRLARERKSCPKVGA